MNIAPNKMVQWLEFNILVMDHLQTYVNEQYGLGYPSETIAEWDESAIKMKLKAYVDRIGKSARGPEDELRDLLKIAHFCCFMYALKSKGDAQASLEVR